MKLRKTSDLNANGGFTQHYFKRRNFKNSAGFTLIEIITVIALFSILLGIGAFASFDAYRLYKFNVEQKNLVSLLTRMRSLSMANYKQQEHGVRIDNASDFTLLHGDEEAEEIPRDEDIELTVEPEENLPIDIIFKQLSGRLDSDITILLTEGERTREIRINEEGGIFWE